MCHLLNVKRKYPGAREMLNLGSNEIRLILINIHIYINTLGWSASSGYISRNIEYTLKYLNLRLKVHLEMHQNIERFFKTDAMEEWCFGNTHNFPRQVNICYSAPRAKRGGPNKLKRMALTTSDFTPTWVT